MAIPCQGFTITWGGQPLQEVQSLELDAQRGLPLGRVTTWTPSLGTLRIAAFSTAHLPESEYGRRKRLTLTGLTSTVFTASPGPVVTFFDHDCIYEDARIEAVANEVVRLAFTFRVQDTVGAPTNP
jgi:hypothetical protein